MKELDKDALELLMELYETEFERLRVMEFELENIKEKKDKFKDEIEFKMRIEHYMKKILTQKEVVARHKAGYEYFMTSIETISNIFENKEIDDNCAICLCEHTPPIKYFK